MLTLNLNFMILVVVVLVVVVGVIVVVVVLLILTVFIRVEAEKRLKVSKFMYPRSNRVCMLQDKRLRLLCVRLASPLTQVRRNGIPLKSS